MPGYAANLVRSGARNLTTRGSNYTAAATLTMLRAAPGKQALPEASGASAAPAPVISAGSQDRYSPANVVAAMQNTQTSRTVSKAKAEIPVALTPVRTVWTSEGDTALSASPAQARPNSEASPQSSPPTLVPVKPQSPGSEARTATLPLETIDPRKVAAATSRQHVASKRDDNIRHEKQTESQAAAAAPSSQRPDIISPVPELMAPHTASHGFYLARRIRVEHSLSAMNPAAALMLQRPASAPSSVVIAKTHAKELRSRPAAPAQPATGFLASRSIPRISAPTQGDAPALATGQKESEAVARPSISSPRPVAGSPLSVQESPFATEAARRNASRQERQPEGPRLSIGLLEVQIIQEASEAPQIRTQPRSLANEQDVLERSYIRQIG